MSFYVARRGYHSRESSFSSAFAGRSGRETGDEPSLPPTLLGIA